MALFGKKKKEVPAGMPEGVPTERVIQMRQQNLSNDQVIQTLQQEGYNSSQIFDAMSQADIKGVVSGEGEVPGAPPGGPPPAPIEEPAPAPAPAGMPPPMPAMPPPMPGPMPAPPAAPAVDRAALAPSPAATMICLTVTLVTSPAANIPFSDVWFLLLIIISL